MSYNSEVEAHTAPINVLVRTHFKSVIRLHLLFVTYTMTTSREGMDMHDLGKKRGLWQRNRFWMIDKCIFRLHRMIEHSWFPQTETKSVQFWTVHDYCTSIFRIFFRDCWGAFTSQVTLFWITVSNIFFFIYYDFIRTFPLLWTYFQVCHDCGTFKKKWWQQGKRMNMDDLERI